MGIKDLPGPGIKFRATVGPGSFKTKLARATRYGLKGLANNQPAIVKAVKGYERAIRVMGGLSRVRRRSAWLKMKASDKTITKSDKYAIQEILKHLGQGTASAAKKVESKAVKKVVPEEIRKRILNQTMQRDPVAVAGNREVREVQYAGGKAQTSSMRAITANPVAGGASPLARGARIVKSPMDIRMGTAADLNSAIKKPTGFAGQYKNNKQPGSPPPKATSLGGARPIGL
jgi:hypothetical protein